MGSFATISGSVLDPDAKAVPIATVVVKNELSGVERMGLSPSIFLCRFERHDKPIMPATAHVCKC